jgi:hypothetical protein
MKRWGGTLLFLGVASMILHAIGVDLSPFAWLDSWGVAAGWVLRSIAVVLGTGILIAARNRNQHSHS